MARSHPAKGKVFVSVVSTPKTRDVLRAELGRSISVKDYTTGMDLLEAEINRRAIGRNGCKPWDQFRDHSPLAKLDRSQTRLAP
ncbi:MAG: hypothetical protein VX951_12040 [Planctomycetota bacterium]|nr:hypothetical protein [Planctomycetota bacterium]